MTTRTAATPSSSTERFKIPRASRGFGEGRRPLRDRIRHEVLLALIVRDGIDALSRARGMFALAVLDARDRSLTLARDRFGIKPMYVASRGHGIAFASEIGALRRASLVDRDVSAAGVLAFLAWSYIPSPLTWLRNVVSLLPGTWRRWHEDGRVEGGTFADYARSYASARDVDEAELRDEVREAIRDSVGAHLVADVPVGSSCLAESTRARSSPPRARDIRPSHVHGRWRRCLDVRAR